MKSELELGEETKLVDEKIKSLKVKVDLFKAKFDEFENRIRNEKDECEKELVGLYADLNHKYEAIMKANEDMNKQILRSKENY